LYLDAFPDGVVCGWRDGKNGHGKRILEGYLNILSASAKLGDGGACCLAVAHFQIVHVKEDTNLVPSNSVASAVVLSTAVRGSCIPGDFISDESGSSTSRSSSPSGHCRNFYA